METLRIVLGEVVVILGLLIMFLLLHIWLLLRKIVVVPTLTVAVDKPSYFKSEPVKISGSLKTDGTAMPGQTIALSIKPPIGDLYSLPDAITDINGDFSADWQVPDDAEVGSYTLTATAVGVMATATFTLK